MTDQWEFKSPNYGNCNCDINCPCQFNQPTTHGFCETFYVGIVDEGHFNGISIEGLKWSVLYKWPGEIAAGDGTAQVIVDERANEAQRKGLETIIQGKSCRPFSNVFSVYGENVSTFLETLSAPIEVAIDLENRTASASIPNVVTSRGYPLTNEFSGEPFHVAIARPTGSIEFTYSEIGLGATTATGEIELAHSDSYAQWCIHHFNQDGLIKDPTPWWRRLLGMGPELRTNP